MIISIHQNNFKTKGFTFVEAVLTIAMIGIMSALAISAVSKGRDTCYSASEAPRQTFFPLPLLERLIVYPIFIGQNAVFMLSDHADFYAVEAEWLSMGSPAVKVITALADPASIRDAISRAGATFEPIGVAQMDKGTMSVSANESVIDIMPEDMARIHPASPNDSAEELVQWAYFTAVG